MHVDFDCLFDKGLTLAKPEIVPFRLTPNLVDAMGPTGVEGSFRRTMEVSLAVLRSNKEVLLSVLEPFLRDPTVCWNRHGRAQMINASTSSSTTLNKRSASAAAAVDVENPEANIMLKKIDERLSGVYNVHHPLRDEIIAGYVRRKEPLPSFGVGCKAEDCFPLSIPGQVCRIAVVVIVIIRVLFLSIIPDCVQSGK